MVINALRGYYSASIGVFGERQKFLNLLQNEDESIGSWETRTWNQASQSEYENFADEFMRDQFIAGLIGIDRFLGNVYMKSSFTQQIWEFRWRVYARPVYRRLNV